MIIWREWRRPTSELWWAVVACSMFYVIFVGWTLVGLHNHVSIGQKSLVVVVGLVYIALCVTLTYRVFVHAKVVAHPEGLTIKNPFRGDQHMAWEEIESMVADRLLLVRGRDGRQRIAWVIQKNGWARMHHTLTDADAAIVELGTLAGRALGTGPKDFRHSGSPTAVAS